MPRKFKPAMPRAKARAIVGADAEWCAVATEPQLRVSASRLEEEHTLSFWDALIVQAAIQVGAERRCRKISRTGAASACSR